MTSVVSNPTVASTVDIDIGTEKKHVIKGDYQPSNEALTTEIAHSSGEENEIKEVEIPLNMKIKTYQTRKQSMNELFSSHPLAKQLSSRWKSFISPKLKIIKE